MPLSFRTIPTRLGDAAIVATSRGLRRVYLPHARADHLRAALLGEFPNAAKDETLLQGLTDDLQRYFAGEPTGFAVRLDTDGASPFLKAVWQACGEISYGQTATYKELAERVGRPVAARAVGSAMRRNPCPIVVPCHRVLGSDGSLGGYSGPGGVELKRRLLQMEAATREQAV